VEELTNAFYQLSIHVDHQEIDEKLDARYVNCLKFSIQVELSMHRVCNVEEAYQLALKVEEKLNQKFSQRNRGARRGTLSSSQGGFNYGRGESSQGDEKVEDAQQCNLNQPRGRGFQRGRGYDGGIGGPYVCFRCGVEGHRAFECPSYNMQELKQGQQPSLNLVQAENEEEGYEFEVPHDMGESLMIHRSMVIPKKEQRKGSDN
jgi:hypothetical protein